MSLDITWANVAIPAVLRRAMPQEATLIHISSAAVQGSMQLDETEIYDCDTPYSLSKAAGEQTLLSELAGQGGRSIIYRPTSVHGSDRKLTKQLKQVFRLPILPKVTGSTSALTVTSASSVARGVAFLADNLAEIDVSSRIVLHPSEHVLQSELVRASGKLLIPVPELFVRTALRLVANIPTAGVRGASRRVSAALLGQPSTAETLIAAGYSPLSAIEILDEAGISVDDHETCEAHELQLSHPQRSESHETY